MDLSKLSADLPLSTPVNQESLEQVNREISKEFKIGARSIAALYRLSNSRTSLLHASGYLECLNDIITLIDRGNASTVGDLKIILEKKRSKLTCQELKDTATSNSLSTRQTPRAEFTMKRKSPFHFPRSKIPIGVRPDVKHRPHGHRHNNISNGRGGKQPHMKNPLYGPKHRTGSSGSEGSDSSNNFNSSDNDSEVVLEDTLGSNDYEYMAQDHTNKRVMIARDCSTKKAKKE